MITKKQYLEAKKIVEQYQQQEYLKSLKPRVRLSEWGIKSQGNNHKTGVISKRIDDLIWVIWDGGKEVSMDVSQIEYIK